VRDDPKELSKEHQARDIVTTARRGAEWVDPVVNRDKHLVIGTTGLTGSTAATIAITITWSVLSVAWITLAAKQ
jgi:dihydrodipicolinate reductase